jgi:hypothetical protein
MIPEEKTSEVTGIEQWNEGNLPWDPYLAEKQCFRALFF